MTLQELLQHEDKLVREQAKSMIQLLDMLHDHEEQKKQLVKERRPNNFKP